MSNGNWPHESGHGVPPATHWRVKAMNCSYGIGGVSHSWRRWSKPNVLSARGQSLSTILVELYSWGDTRTESFGVKVGQSLKIIDGSEGQRETTSLKKVAGPQHA